MGAHRVRLHEIGQFYGERKGWRMFDAQFLTPEVGAYLTEEEEVLLEAMQRGYKRLVEVGCGYGRYLNWAVSRDYDYVGLDIVPWLVELGQLRIGNARKKYPKANCRILLHPAEEIAGISDIANSPDERTLAFFPFNCLGNVSQFEAALDSLKDSKVDVVVSTFKTDGTATKIRKTYYQNCGYEQLNSRLMKEGLLIVSDEGFHAMAYYFNWLMNAFRKRGFDLVATCESGAVGSIYYFEHGQKNVSAETDIEKIASLESEVILYILEEHRTDGRPSAQLLKFKEIRANLKPIEVDRLQGNCRDYLEPGTHLRLALPVVPRQSDDSAYFLDLVGEVVACEDVQGEYALTLRLSKPEPGLFERLAENV
jgi:SAM-dependent methyltransferase